MLDGIGVELQPNCVYLRILDFVKKAEMLRKLTTRPTIYVYVDFSPSLSQPTIYL
jgi:hypothetical protein